jgi:septal ring factor EnvC (AmiA/AmiB activator)
MEEYLDRLVFDNMTQFELYQDTVKDNNLNMNKMRDDLAQFFNQNFEMENINESLEQRLDQLKGQRDLSLKLTRAGYANELKSMLADADRTSQKLVNLQNNAELSWDDKLVIKMRELDDAMRQSSEKSITQMVQNYMQQIRDINSHIVVVTRIKEEMESKLLQFVPDSDLNQLVQEHSSLIREYEEIIREKIGIFTQMINDLRVIADGNNRFVKNESTYADKKLCIEVRERDIHQKNRVDMDIQVEIQNYLTRIDQEEEKIRERDEKIAMLEAELAQARQEYEATNEELNQREIEIGNLEQELDDLYEQRKREAGEEERLRLEEEERLRKMPKQKIKYQAVKGDKVDEKMAFYMNNFDMDVPMQRLGDGQYMFGSRKVFAKIMNDKLVVRVGGGFMLIDEFLPTYGQ